MLSYDACGCGAGPEVPIATPPLAGVNAALNDLRDSRVLGRVVITPQA